MNKELFSTLASLLAMNEEKYRQFNKIYELCVNYTSDSGIDVCQEMYEDTNFHLGTYYRIVIEGTRCKMNITYECGSMKLIRKPKNSKYVSRKFLKTTCKDVLRYIEENSLKCF